MEVGVERLHLEISRLHTRRGSGTEWQNGTLGWGQIIPNRLEIVVIGFSFNETCARIYRPSFHENKPKTPVFSHRKRAFWACFGENWVYI